MGVDRYTGLCLIINSFLSIGEVHIFTIEDRNALESLDFENMKSRKIVLDSTPIVALNATEHGNALYIIAASARKVHFIKRTS